MSGDYTRDTFRPDKAYSAVRMQQGRLFTDADWNEQGDIARDALRQTSADVIGASGFPEDNPGFAILPAGAGNGLAILGGEAYVDGIRVEHPLAHPLSLIRNSGAGASTKWQVDKGPRVAIGDLMVLAGQPIAQAVRVSALFPDVNGKQIFQAAAALSPAASIQVMNFHGVDSQPWLPAPQLPTQPGEYLAYLDVWERPIGAIEDPLIRETAFGGPDTAGRDQIVWQVRFAKLTDLVAAGALTLPASCASFGPGWTPLGTTTAPGAMAARAEAAGAATNPCVLPSTGGYRSLENRLYRVEIHNGGAIAGGAVSIKWSRDNGIHRTLYSAIDGTALLVDSVGRDSDSALQTDDWVEVSDEARLLSGRPGFFVQISDVNGNRVGVRKLLDPDSLAELTDSGSPDMAKLPAQGHVRRWEGGAPQKIAAEAWIKLENGVEVKFAAGRYASRDFWTIPARSITADIEWARDPVTGTPELVPAMGVHHHYCALALATLAAGVWQVNDCRNLFAPLTRQRGFHYLGGDGQEAMPNPLAPAVLIPLGADLRVGYVRGKTPVQGATVRFTVLSGAGRFPNATPVQTVATLADGVAALRWSVDAVTPVQQAIAELLDPKGQRIHLPIIFTANLSTAAKTSFDPAAVPVLAGENTVQGAIEKLAGLQQIGCATRIIVEGSDWVSVLKSLKPGEDATICFQRGTYETQETVTLSGLGHISLSGAGSGTRIVGKRRECALEFNGCASVTVHDLDISTPDGTGAIENFQRRKGALTIVDCAAADVHDLALTCGAGVAAERTCLTVRGGAAPTRSVRIERNRITAGYAQDGILVTDCANGLIADNEFAVAARPGSLTTDKLFEGREWRERLVALLVVNPVSEAFAAGGRDQKAIRGGDFSATFTSSVPQSEWDLLVAATPPTAEDLKTKAGFAAYAERVIDKALTPEHMPPSHKARLARLAGRTGGNALEALSKDVKRGLLIGSEPEVARLDQKMNRSGAIVVAVAGGRILFDSPVSQADWNRALKAIPPERVGRSSDLIGHVESIALRIVTDAKFRARLGSAKTWYEGYIQALPTHGRQAITCAGKSLGTIAVSRNRVEGFVQGVHVGTSERRGAGGQAPRSIAASVTVEGNSLFLRKPGEDVYTPFGLFVGNADTVRIQRNLLAWSNPRGSKESVFAQGIRVWGYLGKFLLIGENRISMASLGIRVRPVEVVSSDDRPQYMWLAADNLVDGVAPAMVIKAPPFMEKRNNRPI